MGVEIVGRETWLAARAALLAEERALTRARGGVNAAQRALPWVRVEKECVDSAEGPPSLADSSEAAASYLCTTPCSRRAGASATAAGRRGRRPPSFRARRPVLGRGLARAGCGDRGREGPDGVDLPLGLPLRKRLQSRLRRGLHAGAGGQRRTGCNYGTLELTTDGGGTAMRTTIRHVHLAAGTEQGVRQSYDRSEALTRRLSGAAPAADEEDRR